MDLLVGEIVSGANDSLFDLTGDGNVSNGDLDAWLAIGAEHNGFSHAYLSGDSNLDGTLDSATEIVSFDFVPARGVLRRGTNEVSSVGWRDIAKNII